MRAAPWPDGYLMETVSEILCKNRDGFLLKEQCAHWMTLLSSFSSEMMISVA